LHEKITELEQYLGSYPADSVHLLIELRRDLKTDMYTAALALRLPEKVLYNEQTEKDVGQAFDRAVTALTGKLKAEKPGPSKQEAHFSERPMAEGTGPQNAEELERQTHKIHA